MFHASLNIIIFLMRKAFVAMNKSSLDLAFELKPCSWFIIWYFVNKSVLQGGEQSANQDIKSRITQLPGI